MEKRVMMLIVGMIVVVGLPAMALCQEEVTEATTVEEEAAVVTEAAEDTGPPFLEEIYAAIDAEAAARGAADTALEAEVDAEEAARVGEDTLLWGAINSWMSLLDAEASTRASADADLQAQIDDILGPSTPPPGVSFGKLVVERWIESSVQPDLFANFVKEWINGNGETADAFLKYRAEITGNLVREVELFGLRPTYYSTSGKTIAAGPFTVVVEHVEFSVENVQILSGDLDEHAALYDFDFRFGGYDLDRIVSVKPPEIYFGQPEVTQDFDHLPLMASHGELSEDVISICSVGDDYWQNVSGAGVNVVPGGKSHIGEDVVLAGDVTGRWIVDDWVKSWIEEKFPLPMDITIEYTHHPYEGGRFIDAVPTSYILPIVSVEPLEIQDTMERLSFTYSGVTE